MSIEALLDRVATAVESNTQALLVLNAGREEALEQLKKQTGETGAPKTTGRRKKVDETPVAAAEGNGAAAAEPITGSAAAASPPAATGPSAEEHLRNEVKAYIDGAGNDEATKAARTENVKAIMAHFGGLLCGPQSNLDDDQKSQALFFVRRYAAGCTVNFSQEYDFAGDPTQGGLEPEAAPADEFNIG